MSQLLYRQRHHDRPGWPAGVPNGLNDALGEDIRHAAIQDRRRARRMEGLRLVLDPEAKACVFAYTRRPRYLYANNAFGRLGLGVLSTATYDPMLRPQLYYNTIQCEWATSCAGRERNEKHSQGEHDKGIEREEKIDLKIKLKFQWVSSRIQFLIWVVSIAHAK